MIVVAGMTGCNPISVKRESADQVQDLSGRWNEQDSKQVAQTMISDCLSRAWLDNWNSNHSNPPVVIVGQVRNMGFEHIDTDSENHWRAATISAFISRTAGARPSNTARAMMACPMLSSTISWMAATGCTL